MEVKTKQPSVRFLFWPPSAFICEGHRRLERSNAARQQEADGGVSKGQGAGEQHVPVPVARVVS